MKLLLISFFILFIIGLCPAQDLNPSIPQDMTNLNGDMLYETKTIRPLAMQKWTGHVRNFFGYSNVDGEITLGKDVITQAIHRGYAAFDISVIPYNAVITRISLMVYTTTASWSNEHTVNVKTLNVDPVVSQGEYLYNSIGNGVTISDLNWKPMNATGFNSTELNGSGIWNLQYFINQGYTRWYIGFQENLDNDAWGNFRGWNSPELPEPYCVVEYTVPTFLISISPASLSFGNVQVGQTSTRSINISNLSNISTISGTINISGSGFTLVGAGNYFFLSPGMTMGFTVKFSPLYAGSFSGSVGITHNATNLSSPFNVPLTGTGTASTTFPLTVSISNGWNMVSIPGLLSANQNVTTWWPGKDPAAGVFKFATGYQVITAAAPGTGYWMKHDGSQTYNSGDEWPLINLVTHDPLPGIINWNLIGGYECAVPVGSITTTPPGLITGSIFKYSSGYLAATQLDPGYAYWVKLTGPGTINIPSCPVEMPGKEIAVDTDDFGKIMLTDNAQRSYTLYAAGGQVDLSQFDMPPVPPQGIFDVRFSTQRYAEDLSTSQGIEMSGVEYPVTIRAAGKVIIVSDETGRMIASLNKGEEVTIPSAQKLFVSEDVIPMVYGLEQNYPNPFNPSTTIQFSIPEDVQNVKLIIYNALGEKIIELVNTSLKAGIHKYSWNASDVASGMYIYQLITEKFVSTKKLLLLK